MPLIMLIQELVTLDFHSANLEFGNCRIQVGRRRDKWKKKHDDSLKESLPMNYKEYLEKFFAGK